MKYNVLLLGGGGREHALAWGMAKSSMLDELFIAPGNPGTAQHGKNVSLDTKNFEEILAFIEEQHIHLTVAGPEQPLVEGIADFLEEKGHKVFGPKKAAAMLEGSKEFAKQFMKRHDIPTADFEVFEQQNFDDAEAFIKENNQYPVVLKADGLAGGKGVFICESEEDAVRCLNELKKNPFGGAANRLVIEEFMQGEEASVFAICDGQEYKIIGNAQDHKRIGEGDTGLNTGGMGAYSPAPVVTEAVLNEVEQKIIGPVIQGMKEEGNSYQGILYCGLMITEEGPKVVEFNCRFGDPECQVIVPALKSDLLALLLAAVEGEIANTSIDFDERHYCCVVMASEGYPKSYEKGKKISGIEEISDGLVFHAGTHISNGSLITNGGRVLSVVGGGDTLTSAIQHTYRQLDLISFENAYFRRDIGAKGLKHVS